MSEKLYHDYGLTDEDWNEIVDFYWQMFMMVHDAERRIEQRPTGSNLLRTRAETNQRSKKTSSGGTKRTRTFS